jgi:hypothetical protein
LNGADELLHPFRAYSFQSNVTSYHYSSPFANNPTYLLLFPAPVHPDADGNGTVDGADHAALLECLEGPAEGGVPAECRMFDLNQDDTVDLADLSRFQNRYGTSRSCAP